MALNNVMSMDQKNTTYKTRYRYTWHDFCAYFNHDFLQTIQSFSQFGLPNMYYYDMNIENISFHSKYL